MAAPLLFTNNTHDIPTTSTQRTISFGEKVAVVLSMLFVFGLGTLVFAQILYECVQTIRESKAQERAANNAIESSFTPDEDLHDLLNGTLEERMLAERVFSFGSSNRRRPSLPIVPAPPYERPPEYYDLEAQDFSSATVTPKFLPLPPPPPLYHSIEHDLKNSH